MTDIAPSESKIQQESVQFNKPTTEASMTAIGALANGLRELILPVGSVIYSMLDEATFQSQNTSPTPVRWIIADGRDVTGSVYQNLTGLTTVPDLRGIFVRGKSGSRADGNQNPDGDLALGTFTSDKLDSHNHAVSDPGHAHSFDAAGIFNDGGYSDGNNRGAHLTFTTASSTTGITISNTGGNETAPKSVTLNPFIRIN